MNEIKRTRKPATFRSGILASAGALMVAGAIAGTIPGLRSNPDTEPANGERVASGKTGRLVPGGAPQRCSGQDYGGLALDCANAIFASQKLATVRLYHDPAHATSYWVRTIDTSTRHVSRVIAY